MNKLYLIGCGMGNESMLTAQAKELMEKSNSVFAFDRIGELFKHLCKNMEICSYSQLVSKIKAQTTDCAVLLSGDVCFFSMANTLKNEFDATCEVVYVNGISSLQYLCGKLKVNTKDVSVVSLHGRNHSLLGSIAYNEHTFVLTGGENNASVVLKNLAATGFGDFTATAGENLAMKSERIVTNSIKNLAQMQFCDLTVLFIENKNFVNNQTPLFDEDFTRNKTPMTKQEIRWIAVNNLCINKEDIVLDIGAGSGSVSVECARKAYKGVVYAIEKDQRAFELLEENIKKLGALNVIAKKGDAFEEIKKLPVPNCVFVGGSGGELKAIMHYLLEKNPQLKYVITAVTVETFVQATEIFKELNIDVNISLINSARTHKAGAYNLFKANNPVYIISGEQNAKY